jgi:ubiquinone/menaquinone biosynthesis C-methylase UbiE
MPSEITPDVARFNRWAKSYDQSLMQRWYFGAVHSAMVDRLCADRSASLPGCVLDVGCGTGRLLRAVGQRWSQVKLIGVDPAENMVAEAKRLTPTADIRVAPAESIPFSDASVDLALTSLSFHHWRDQQRGIKEIARVLRSGGRFCLADHTVPAWLAMHEAPRPLNEIKGLMSEAGLTVLEHKRMWSRFVVIVIARKGPATEAQSQRAA